jgi:hypothetical protein
LLRIKFANANLAFLLNRFTASKSPYSRLDFSFLEFFLWNGASSLFLIKISF